MLNSVFTLSLHLRASLSTLELNHFLWDVCVAKIYIFFCLNIDGFKLILWHEAGEFRLSHIRFGGRKKRKKEDEGVSFLERDTKDLTEQRSSSSPERSCPAARLQPSPPLPSIKTHGAGFYWGLTLTDWLTSAIFMCVCVCVCVWVGGCVCGIRALKGSQCVDWQTGIRAKLLQS